LPFAPIVTVHTPASDGRNDGQKGGGGNVTADCADALSEDTKMKMISKSTRPA
jgi:hypothetical protein